MAIVTKAKESVAQRVLGAFDRTHMTKCHRLMQAGLNAETLEELVELYRKIELEDTVDRTPEDKRPTPVSPEEIHRPRPGCV